MSDAPPAHHRPGGGYRNPWPGAEARGIRDVIKWSVQRRLQHHPPDPAPGFFPAAIPAFTTPHAAADQAGATWVGHSTVLLQVAGRNVLIDPIWSDRASPLAFAGPKRVSPPGIQLDGLPPIDVVLVSHNHYDHLDERTVRRLADRHPGAAWVTLLGVAPLLTRWGAARVHQLDWWDTCVVEGLDVTATPAQHFSARGLRDRDATLWGGFVVASNGRRVFYAGDTGLHPEFGTIASRCGPFDLTILPIGAYEPRWFMRPVHMNPDDAVAAYRSLCIDGSSPAMLGVHWGTFRLTDEGMDQPPLETRRLWREAGLPEDRLWILRHGETRFA